jgi:hypothetical protein
MRPRAQFHGPFVLILRLPADPLGEIGSDRGGETPRNRGDGGGLVLRRQHLDIAKFCRQGQALAERIHRRCRCHPLDAGHRVFDGVGGQRLAADGGGIAATPILNRVRQLVRQ